MIFNLKKKLPGKLEYSSYKMLYYFIRFWTFMWEKKYQKIIVFVNIQKRENWRWPEFKLRSNSDLFNDRKLFSQQ